MLDLLNLLMIVLSLEVAIHASYTMFDPTVKSGTEPNEVSERRTLQAKSYMRSEQFLKQYKAPRPRFTFTRISNAAGLTR